MSKWLIYATVSLFAWALWSLVSPVATRDISPNIVQVLSSIGLVPFAGALLFSSNLKRGTNIRKGCVLAVATGITAGLGNVLLYQALANGGPVSVVFPVTSMAPLVPVLAAPFLFRERLRRIQILGIAIALIAIYLLNTAPAGTAPTAHPVLVSKWMLYTILCLIVFGFTFLTQKGATYFISDELSTVAYTAGFLLLDIPLLVMEPFDSARIPVLGGSVSLLIGILMGVGSLTLFAAYRHGKASVVTPYSQLFPIITVLAGVPLYGERLDLLRSAGVVAALAAGVILSIEKPEAAPVSREAVAAE